MKFFKNKKGFTLVELVVVIAILGILAGIAVPRFMDATATARGSKIIADLRTIDSAVTMYLANDATGTAPVAAATGTTAGAIVPKYLATWPVPPSGTAKITNSSGTAVEITGLTATYTLDTAANGYRAKCGTQTADTIAALAVVAAAPAAPANP